MKFAATYNGTTLQPYGLADAVAMEALPQACLLAVSAVKPRSGKQHRLWWGFAALVAKAMNDGPHPYDTTPDDVDYWMRLGSGHCQPTRIPKSLAKNFGVEKAIRVKSIAFNKMGGDEFGRLLNKAFIFVRDEYCQWLPDSEHFTEIQNILQESQLVKPAKSKTKP